MGLRQYLKAYANPARLCSHGLLLSALFIFECSAQATVSEEMVIATVECKVKDPGELRSYLGLKRGSLVRIETLSSYESTLIVDGEIYISGFPAVLNFNNRSRLFSIAGASDLNEGSNVMLQIQGSLLPKGEASFLFNVKDESIDVSGTAKMNSCKRLY